ncbi:unnamed protein product [Haemonchus placei]|uniref:Uncharacterized protein n=1 Tax=Haemonchus placei TaxID=6290 RepID=A0A3P7WE74_HAEPC|nr:unnamed protein product [Haemonchus placei]
MRQACCSSLLDTYLVPGSSRRVPVSEVFVFTFSNITSSKLKLCARNSNSRKLRQLVILYCCNGPAAHFQAKLALYFQIARQHTFLPSITSGFLY